MNNIKFKSVTELKNKCVPKFNSVYWSLFKAIRNTIGYSDTQEDKSLFKKWLIVRKIKLNIDVNNLYDLIKKEKLNITNIIKIQKETLNQWKFENEFSINKGNELHNLLEDNQVFKEEYIESKDILYNIWELEDGVYKELYVYSNKYKIHGKIDNLEIITLPSHERIINITDYKTHKKFNINSNFKLLNPLNHLDNTEFYIDSLQVNLYALILTDWGFKIGDMTITNYPKNVQQFDVYKCLYLQHEAKLLTTLK